MSNAEIESPFAQVIVDLPGVRHSTTRFLPKLRRLFATGLRCVVPLGRNSRVGIVVGLDRPTIDLEQDQADHARSYGDRRR